MKKNKFPKIKKSVKDFLTNEDGKLSKKDIAKIAMGILVTGLGVSGLSDGTDHADAACSHGNHSNAY